MEDSRTRRLRRTLDALHLLRLDRLLGRWTAGRGVVFTLHHCRPAEQRAFAPNHLLGITPDFLDDVLGLLRERGIDVVTLDEALRRIQDPDAGRFACFTFDDGYRDVRDHALPVLRRHGAPAMLFVTSGFADGTGDLWWLRLEHAIAGADKVHFAGDALNTRTDEEKAAAWEHIYWTLRGMDEATMRQAIDRLEESAGTRDDGLTARLCLDWDELREVAADPLVTIGNHTCGHFMLAKLGEDAMRREITGAQQRIRSELGVEPRHIAFPVGDPTSAGVREFRTAEELGFAGGWTTRLGTLFPAHAAHMTALPRVSLNGHYQQRRYAETFISGLPFVLRNRLRVLDVA
ncbi:polysaccharide deacetylase family protein [Terrihabitans rhizophilus]|uniref:Chitooligosaccharide deacetylase n=1 Tax=Terrihabitans rhizophilus TaxID=3092662 RepID=A0ABU4RQE6_9HYPH|nr:polysaccharide deacetylase family protein [Terrihabitans sp. PJ23]MDX6807087.1 polysaccharide deacetylase family protein [Terrihabitans sp. PJ23]